MMNSIRALGFAGMLTLLVSAPLSAQFTPGGTTITNTAVASWIDSNANTFTPVSGSVAVQVGVIGLPDVSSPATVTPSSPSSGNELAFTVTNAGNGADQFSVSTSAAAGVTITGYKLGATTYVTLAELNSALAAANVAASSSITVTVFYTVAPRRGGQTSEVSLTATSLQTPGATDISTTNVIPAVVAGVNVAPDAATVDRLRSNGTQYIATFLVTNEGNASDTFALSAASSDFIAIIATQGTAGPNGSITLDAAETATVDVMYTVGSSAARGAVDNVQLTATSDADPSTSDAGNVSVRVVAPSISVTKEAYRDDQTEAVTGVVLPGEYIYYKITLTNTGTAMAQSVSVSDILPVEVAYVSSAADAAGWTISESSGTVTATLANLAQSSSRFFWIRVQVQ